MGGCKTRPVLTFGRLVQSKAARILALDAGILDVKKTWFFHDI